ncbi:MAG: S26 family signal peptidase [Sphingomonas sp. 28-62-20]|uniref:S26 family signal peptidase n=1 Tax=Sphingomonas sp. 28-62-20 TaxID=1970433 RepID=UPI000BCD7761|nr:MAG: S26 family signal peptidase [Sphingomonas sp. 28-62-20]
MTTHLKTLVTMQAAAMLLAFGSWIHPMPRLIWNASASVPVGLYAVQPARSPRRKDLVVVSPPAPLADFLAEGGYLPRGVPLLKRVAAVGGQRVCRIGLTVTVDGAAFATALDKDHRGRELPRWSGCVTLTETQVLLLNRDVPDSLDGRYFGPLPTSTIVGRAQPIWTRKGA